MLTTRKPAPTLFISATLDSNTPPEQPEEIRKRFRSTVHLIVENAGHESTLPRADVRQTIVRFLAGDAIQDQRLQGNVRFLSPELAKRVLGIVR